MLLREFQVSSKSKDLKQRTDYKPKTDINMNSTKAICDAMSILSTLDEFIKTHTGQRFTDVTIELAPILNGIADEDIRMHFITLIGKRVDEINEEIFCKSLETARSL